MVENNFHFRGKMLILTTYISMKIRSKKHVYFIYFWKYSYKTCSKHGCDIFKSIYFQKSLLITWNSTSKNFMVSHVAMVVAWMLLLRKRVKRAIFGDLLRLWGLWRVLGHHYVDGGTPSWCKYCVKSQTFWNPFKKLKTQDIFCSVFDFGPFFFKKKF